MSTTHEEYFWNLSPVEDWRTTLNSDDTAKVEHILEQYHTKEGVLFEISAHNVETGIGPYIEAYTAYEVRATSKYSSVKYGLCYYERNIHNALQYIRCFMDGWGLRGVAEARGYEEIPL